MGGGALNAIKMKYEHTEHLFYNSTVSILNAQHASENKEAFREIS